MTIFVDSWEKVLTITAQKMKFSIKDFFSKCDQIRRKLRVWSHLLKKFLMENFIFCAVRFVNISTWLKITVPNNLSCPHILVPGQLVEIHSSDKILFSYMIHAWFLQLLSWQKLSNSQEKTCERIAYKASGFFLAKCQFYVRHIVNYVTLVII